MTGKGQAELLSKSSEVETIETESLGNRGYLVHDNKIAIAIDVQRDYERWIDRAKQAGVTITHVFETHMHNDYLTGGYQLAKQIGAVYVVPIDSGIKFQAKEIADNEKIFAGNLKITGIFTPGHTDRHMSYMVQGENLDCIFTGGSLLYGTVGRTDLLGETKTLQLTEAQYESAHHLANTLRDDTAVFPTHGFGSFCSSTEGSGENTSTMLSEKQINIVFNAKTREEFIKTIISGLGPYPSYYRHMGSINQNGPQPVPSIHIHDYPIKEISQYLTARNVWVVDTRQRLLFAANHPKGAVNFELGDSFTTYVGWLLPWSDKLILAGDSNQDLIDAYRDLSRIGMESFVDGAISNQGDYLNASQKTSYPVVSFKTLSQKLNEKPFILDVRLLSDWDNSHINQSTNIPLHKLTARSKELAKDRDIWVHCAGGYRASIAASLLDKLGFSPILINDDFQTAVTLGLTNK